MEAQMSAVHDNGTWELVLLPLEKSSVVCRWVFTVKYNSDGTVEQYKVHLVDKGYTQTYGVDYAEIFSPLAKIASVRVLISTATHLGCPVECQ